MAISENSNYIDRGKILLRRESVEIPIIYYKNDMEQTEIPWHWQDGLEFGLVISGEIEVSVGCERFLLKAGDGFFVNSGALNACRQLPETTGECIIRAMVFDPRVVEGTQESLFYENYISPLFTNDALKGTALTQNTAWHKEILRLLNKSWECCTSDDKENESSIIDMLSQIIFLLSAHSSSDSRIISAKDAKDAERIKTMLLYIDEHYKDDLNVSILSESAEISESEAMRCFHNMLGTTPIQYVKYYRIRKAAELLKVSDDKIVDIAIDCGFQDMSYFAKTFRETRGITPTDYREKFKKT